MFLDHLQIALLMIRAKPVRSALSWLGIYIGVLSLVGILSLREGIRRELEDTYRMEGARVVMVQPSFDRDTRKFGRITFDDVERISSTPGVQSVLPRLQDQRDVRTSGGAQKARVSGIDEEFIPIYRIPVVTGRAFLPREVAAKHPVCLLTQEFARELFPLTSPIGASIDVQGTPLQVIGIVEWKEGVAARTMMMEAPQIFLPLPWLRKKGTENISMLEVRTKPDISAEQAVALVTEAITRGDANRAKIYRVMTLEKQVEKRKEGADRMLYTLLAIAAISLLVGGIGIANVMLTSVTERTREVGIRKALGATRKDILLQFLVESSALCVSGGLLAILTGAIGISLWNTLSSGKIPAALPQGPMAICVGLTLLIGLIAGLYPASRAASLSPAEALRYE